MSEPSPNVPKNWKRILKHEMREYFFNFGFLAFFLVAFAWYRRLIMEASHINYFGYWAPLIEAAVLAKVVMIGDALRMGRRFQDRPLIVTTVYRTAVFSVFTGLFTVLEHIVGSLVHGRTAAEGWQKLTGEGWQQLLAGAVIIAAAFLPFFAYKELERVIGAEKLRALFLCRQASSAEKNRVISPSNN